MPRKEKQKERQYDRNVGKMERRKEKERKKEKKEGGFSLVAIAYEILTKERKQNLIKGVVI